MSAHADHAAAFPNALDGMGCLAPNPCNGYELTADLDFDTNGSGRPDPGDAYWDGGHGWLPIGDPETEFRYNTVFDGGGHTIANLFIYWPESSHAGLFRATGADDEIRNVRLTGVRVIGQNSAGALVGSNSGLIERSSADGQVSSISLIGGIAGYNSGSISNSKAVVAVEGSGDGIGGLVGRNAGTIADSSARGEVTGEGYYVGGLAGVGYNNSNCGAISGSHATGAVAGEGSYVGGLVGYSGCGTISGSYATGNVTGEGGYIGGLAGATSGTITASYATGDVAGEGYNVGGLAGHAAGAITASYATGNVAGENDNVGGLVGIGGLETTETYRFHSGRHILTITASYATGNVSGDENVGGLVGSAHRYFYRGYGSSSGYYSSAVKNTGSYATGKVSGQANVGGLVGGGRARAGGLHSYWDTQTSGVSSSYGGAGKTTRELQTPTGNTGIYSRWNADWWDFGTRSQYPVLKYEGMDAAAQRP